MVYIDWLIAHRIIFSVKMVSLVWADVLTQRFMIRRNFYVPSDPRLPHAKHSISWIKISSVKFSIELGGKMDFKLIILNHLNISPSINVYCRCLLCWANGWNTFIQLLEEFFHLRSRQNLPVCLSRWIDLRPEIQSMWKIFCSSKLCSNWSVEASITTKATENLPILLNNKRWWLL